MPHTYDEIVMGHKIWFPDSVESDVVSATANSGGFTPLTAIARRYNWGRDLVEAASNQCNSRGEIAILREVTPTLLLVPSTNGREEVSFLINDLLQAANQIKADVLNFTHYGFVQNKLPIIEIRSILKLLLDPDLKSAIRVVIWDIDLRFKDEMIRLWKSIRDGGSD
jgi:hypothetical protein